MGYTRPWKCFPEQLEMLKSRGMVVTHEAAALDYLQRVGYYRLSAYWYPFRKFEVVQDDRTGKLATKAVDEFQPGTQFVDAVHLYLFDKQLRLYLGARLELVHSLRSEEHTSELQSRGHLVCRLLLETNKADKRQT